MANYNWKEVQPALSRGASAAGAAKGAIKTGKALSGMAGGAAAGPYGVLAAGLRENRHAIRKLLAASAALLVLPVLFLLMLPSLVFGDLDAASPDVLGDNARIMENIAGAEASIESILRDRHDAVLDEIQQNAGSLGAGCDYGITDDFSDRIIYESALVISQFCASQEDYQEASLKKLGQILRENSGGIFTYTVETTEHEETDAETGETRTICHYEYTVQYAGDSYFARNVFRLTDSQMQTAADYAANLHLFLSDTVYRVETNPDLLPGETGNKAVDLALTKLGTPYSQAHRNEEGYFDCSSFTYWVYSQLGVILQHGGSNTAASQARYIAENGLAISYDSLAPGDLVFYSFGVNNRYMDIRGKAYTVLEGTCTDTRLKFFGNSRDIMLTDKAGNRHVLRVGKGYKIRPGLSYRFYFRTPGSITPGQSPLLAKAVLADSLLGVEEIAGGSSPTN